MAITSYFHDYPLKTYNRRTGVFIVNIKYSEFGHPYRRNYG